MWRWEDVMTRFDDRPPFAQTLSGKMSITNLEANHFQILPPAKSIASQDKAPSPPPPRGAAPRLGASVSVPQLRATVEVRPRTGRTFGVSINGPPIEQWLLNPCWWLVRGLYYPILVGDCNNQWCLKLVGVWNHGGWMVLVGYWWDSSGILGFP